MNEQNHDPFDILFQRAQVDLPDHLRHRLLSIPGPTPSVSFWDSRSMFPILAIAPGVIWFLINHSGPFWQWLGNQLVMLAGTIPTPDPITITTNALYIGTGVLILSAITGAWLLIRQGRRAQIDYVRQLTSAG